MMILILCLEYQKLKHAMSVHPDISFECNGAGELLYIYILQPMLHEVGNKKPHLTWLIQEHQHDFLHLINGAVEEDEGKT